jgi:hypothetical protein
MRDRKLSGKIVGGIVTGVFLVISLFGCSSAPEDTGVPATTRQPIQGSSAAVLGGTEAAFASRYGPPNDHSIPDSGIYHFQRYPHSNLDYLIVFTDIVDGGRYRLLVNGLEVQANTTWDIPTTEAISRSFFPLDARRIKEATVIGSQHTPIGVVDTYYSASLATEFPPSAFTDNNLNPVRVGTFDEGYLYDLSDHSKTDGCSFFLGQPLVQGWSGT